MSATESPKEGTLNPPAGSTELEKLRALIADDAFAATFQTMGRYRTALLQIASALARSPTPNVEAVVTDHSVEVDKMVGIQRNGFPSSLERAAAIVRWVAHLFSTIAAIDASRGTPVNLSFERKNFNRALAKLHEATALLSASSSESHGEPETNRSKNANSPAQTLT